MSPIFVYFRVPYGAVFLTCRFPPCWTHHSLKKAAAAASNNLGREYQKHHYHHQRHQKKTPPSSETSSMSNSDVSDLSDGGYEGGEDNNTLSARWNGAASNSDTSDDDIHPPSALDLPPPRSRTSSRNKGSNPASNSPRPSFTSAALSPLSVGVPPMGQTLNGAVEQLPDLTIRILLLGDSGVGKTSLMMRYSDDKFAYSLIATAGVDFKVKNMDIPNPAYNKSAAKDLAEASLQAVSEEERDLRILLSKPFLRVRCQIWDTAGQEKVSEETVSCHFSRALELQRSTSNSSLRSSSLTLSLLVAVPRHHPRLLPWRPRHMHRLRRHRLRLLQEH